MPPDDILRTRTLKALILITNADHGTQENAFTRLITRFMKSFSGILTCWYIHNDTSLPAIGWKKVNNQRQLTT